MSRRLMCLTLAMLTMGVLSVQSARAADPSLVGWWKLDEGSGLIAHDSSGNSNDGDFTGGLTWTEGKLAGALHFDGSTGYVTIPGDSSIAVINQGDFACFAWIKTDAVDGANQYAIQQADGNGTGRSWLFIAGDDEIRSYVGNATTASAVYVEPETWYHAGFVVHEGGGTDTVQMYVNGVAEGAATQLGMETCGGAFYLGAHKGLAAGTMWTGVLDDVRIYNRALSEAELPDVMAGVSELARYPQPADGQTDVPREATLGWSPGEFAATHDIYLGTSLDDVTNADRSNPLDVLVSQGQAAATYDTDRLEFGQTYYWRVDEVNAAPDNTIFTGDVWSFTTELYAYPIENVVATSNGISEAGAGAENTVNGSGLNADDQHSVESTDMWLAEPAVDEPTTIEFAFGRVYKLDQMLVWNYNVGFEQLLGFGVKTATIEYSADGADWVSLGDMELAQATGQETYTANTTIDFGGVAAQYVRLTVVNGFGAMGQYGLSEVRFLAVPVYASEPEPAEGATDVSVAANLSWKAGREAAMHDVYLGTDPAALTLIDSVDVSTVDPGPLDLATTYYWQIDEVNEAEAITAWAGPVWSFATEPFITVEDFESYNDEDKLIYEAWIDGWGNGTGSTVGYLEAPFAEQTIVHGGGQSMPLFYDNTGGQTVSEAELTLAEPQDWLVSGVQSLSLFVYGDASNTEGQLYLKINNTTVSYTGLSDVLRRPQWVPWTIDLAGTGASLGNVTSLAIGIEGAGATGLIFVDDLRLYPQAAELIEPTLPADDDPNLVAYYPFEGNGDDSMGNYPAEVFGEPLYVTGKSGQAIAVDGIVDYVAAVFAQEELWPACSVSVWARTDTLGQPQYSSVFNNNSNSDDFQIDVDGGTPGNYRYWGTSGAVFGPVSTEWVHLAVSCDGTTTGIYYNGLLSATLNVADTRFGQIAFGINRAADNQFTGAIDEARIYNRALSDAEVAGLAGLSEPVTRPF